MKINYKSRSFGVGFAIVLILWILVNLKERGSRLSELCFDCDKGFGKPFRMYESSTLGGNEHIVWGGTIANILLVILTGLLLGSLFYLLWNNLLLKLLRK